VTWWVLYDGGPAVREGTGRAQPFALTGDGDAWDRAAEAAERMRRRAENWPEVTAPIVWVSADTGRGAVWDGDDPVCRFHLAELAVPMLQPRERRWPRTAASGL
jgi:hypothetical protein